MAGSREDCREAALPLLEVLVTVLALWGATGLGDKVRGSGGPLHLGCGPRWGSRSSVSALGRQASGSPPSQPPKVRA